MIICKVKVLEQTPAHVKTDYGQSCCVTTNEGILNSMGEIMDVLKEGGFQRLSSKPVSVLSRGYSHLSNGLKLVNAMIVLLSEQKHDAIIPAPILELEPRSLRPL